MRGAFLPPAPPSCVNKHSALRSVPSPPPAATRPPTGTAAGYGSLLRAHRDTPAGYALGLAAWPLPLRGPPAGYGATLWRGAPPSPERASPWRSVPSPRLPLRGPLRGRRRLRLLPFGLLCIVNRNVSLPPRGGAFLGCRSGAARFCGVGIVTDML